MEKLIYLDNAATTFPKSIRVYDVMDEVSRTCAVNAGRGAYRLANKANSIIENTKKQLLELVNAPSTSKVVFTPSITIALNMILQGIDWKKGDIVYISPYEHNAVARTLEKIRNDYQIEVRLMPLSDDYEINIRLLEDLFVMDKPKCVCCTGISNVTGYILPTNEIFEAAKIVNAITILDSAQSLGLIEQDCKNIDFIAFAGHKALYGPFGIGGFIYQNSVNLDTVIVGGTGSDSLNLAMPQEPPYRYEPASANIVAIAGLNAALEEMDVLGNYQNEKQLTEYLVRSLEKIPEVRLFIPNRDNHIGIVSFNLRNSGLSADEVGRILDEEFGIAVRTGYHCAPYIHDIIGDIEYKGTVRIGLGKYNSYEDIDFLCEAIEGIV